MHFIEHLNFKTLKYDLVNKFFYKKTKSIPAIKKIILNFGSKTTDLKFLSSSLLALELITLNQGKLTTTNKTNVVLKIRKGNPVGCKIILQNKQMFCFLENIFVNIFPNIKNFDGITLNKIIDSKTFSYQLKETLNFNELKKHYHLFNNLPNLNINIITNAKNKKELIFLLKSIQFPIKI